MKTIFPINSELINLIERLDYETLSSSNTIATLVETSQDIDILKSDLFAKYDKAYVTKFMEYDIAKQIVSKTISAEYNEQTQVVNWTLDFATGKLKLDVQDVPEQYKKKIAIDVDVDEINTLLNLHYSVVAKRSIINKIFERNKLNPDADKIATSDTFIEYQNQLAKTERDYELEKERLSAKLIPDCFAGHSIRWSFDFLDNQFIIYVLCECGVDVYEDR